VVGSIDPGPRAAYRARMVRSTLALVAVLLAASLATLPRVQEVVGAIEARLVRADRLILAGLEEGVWPAGAPIDPFLSRPMRKLAGLPPPERRIGLSAHDFAQAACAPDVVLLVTEPTAFGLYDLMLAVEMVSALHQPMGVVINRADIGDDRVERYCAMEGIAIWGRSVEVLHALEEAQREQQAGCDCYPYAAGSSSSSTTRAIRPKFGNTTPTPCSRTHSAL